MPTGIIPFPPLTRAEDERAGQETLGELTREYQISRDDAQKDRAERLVARLAAAAGGSHETPWHVTVFDAPNVKNAAATRGNFLFIWSGLLDYLRTDEELAVILAHELGHILAGHVMPDPAELASQAFAQVGGAVTGQIVASSARMGLAGDLAGQLTQLALEAMLVNPGQRRLETEADEIGLFLLAKSGFNPDAAILFWERVQNDPAFGSGSLSFLSSHPSSTDRFAHLRGLAALAARLKLTAWTVSVPSTAVYEFPSRTSDFREELRKGEYFFGNSDGSKWVCGPRGCVAASALTEVR